MVLVPWCRCPHALLSPSAVPFGVLQATKKQIGKSYRAHRAYTCNDGCFFLFVDVTKQFVARWVVRPIVPQTDVNTCNRVGLKITRPGVNSAPPPQFQLL